MQKRHTKLQDQHIDVHSRAVVTQTEEPHSNFHSRSCILNSITAVCMLTKALAPYEEQQAVLVGALGWTVASLTQLILQLGLCGFYFTKVCLQVLNHLQQLLVLPVKLITLQSTQHYCVLYKEISSNCMVCRDASIVHPC